jgi:pimeloyl-ACP methyl ester carboxylesterase
MKGQIMKPGRFASTVAFVLVSAGAATMLSQAQEPLSIAQQGYLFAGGKYTTVDNRQLMTGQLYAEFQIPGKRTHPWPIIMVHGGGQTGTNFTGTPDGREGWAQYFLRQGYAVYVVDQVGRGRSAYAMDVYGPMTPSPNPAEGPQTRFAAPERYNLWPQARLHTQWPGKGAPGDPVFDQFFASQVTGMAANAVQPNRDALLALLDKTGPAILMTHSQSGAIGWPVADARPDLVKALISVEPNGPPFYAVENVPAPEWLKYAPSANTWGMTSVPLAYSPRAERPADLALVQENKADAPDLVRCWMQTSPARSLPNLGKVAHLIVTAEASYHANYDHCTFKYLQQAGVKVTYMKLADIGIRGNGHMMMLEKNNMEVAGAMARWLAQAVPATAAAR